VRQKGDRVPAIVYVSGQDQRGRMLVRLYERTVPGEAIPGEPVSAWPTGVILSAQEFPVEAGQFVFAADDRRSIKRSIDARGRPFPGSGGLHPGKEESPAPPEILPGDLIVASHAEGRSDDDGYFIRLVGNLRHIARRANPEEAVAAALACPEISENTSAFWCGPQTSAEVVMDADEYASHSEPDMALVLAWADESSHWGQQTAIIARKGAYMWWAACEGNNCEDCSISEPDGAGLWLMEGGKSWTSTDWESGMADGWGFDFANLRKVTPVDAAGIFGQSLEQIISAIRDAYPYPIPDRPNAFEEIASGAAAIPP
jgi:hypothetical protein